MVNLNPDEVTELVTKAFLLEAITDKKGFTTRYEVLPGKPLQDFILAGINSAKYFGILARELKNGTNDSVFAYSVEALAESNKHKSDKYINIGLLEIMFLVVAARMNTDDRDRVVAEAVSIANNTSNTDVMNIISMRKLAWSTSLNSHKAKHDFSEYENCKSIIDYFALRCRSHPEDTSYYQWSNQYIKGFPILKDFLNSFNKNGEILNTTKDVFLRVMKENPNMRVGIVADMCAAAIFLWLSFNTEPV